MDIFVLDLLIFVLKGDSLFYYTNLLSATECERNNKIILKYCQLLKNSLCD